MSAIFDGLALYSPSDGCGQEALRINFEGIKTLNGDLLVELAAQNPLLSLETEGKHILLVKFMPNHNKNQASLTNLLIELGLWNKTTNNKKGQLYDSGGSISFDDGSIKMPDITYILKSRLEGQPGDKVILIVPDFVVEYVSTFDSLNEAKQKMAFYLSKGVALGWLIVPKEENTYIYRQDSPVTSKKFGEVLSGESVLPGFSIVLADIFE